MPEVALYEAVVTDGRPDPDRPGHVKLKIPGMFGDTELPVLVPPMFPGVQLGGWQSIPEEDDRITVIHMGRMSFRWLGATFGADDITGTQRRSGAVSADGRTRIWIDDDGAVVDSDGKAVIRLLPDGTVSIEADSILLRAVGAGPPAHPFIISRDLLTDWQSWLTAFDAFVLATSTATTAPQIAAAAAIFIASQPTGTFVGKHATSLASGPPYLSTRTKGD